MFEHLMSKLLPKNIMCISVGSVAHEHADFILGGTSIELKNTDHLPHPSNGRNGWMMVNERDRYVRQSCIGWQ
jgi:hypothetical protein